MEGENKKAIIIVLICKWRDFLRCHHTTNLVNFDQNGNGIIALISKITFFYNSDRFDFNFNSRKYS